MKTKEFDDQLRTVFEENDFEYKPENWDRLSWMLDNNKPEKKRSIWPVMSTGIAASVALMAAMLYYNSPSNITQLASIVKEGYKPYTNPNTLTPTEIEHTNIPPANNSITPYKKPTNRESIIPLPEANINTVVTTEANTKEKSNDANHVMDEPTKQHENINLMANVPNNSKHGFVKETYPPLPEDNRYRKVHFSLGGGYNYGSLGSGYTIGATAQKKLSNKFYLEGDLALLNNSAENVTTTQSYPTYGFTTTGGGIGTANNPPTYTTSINNFNLFYVQVTPVLGYNVNKKVNLGMGADFQQLLQDKHNTVTDMDGNVYAIPGLDVGVIGKAEYSFSSRIKTSVSYREGMNGVIDQGKKYLERDYLQVQLKYRLNK